eukprot:CAMPEP_0197531256 /NCGR_PEP_ID=MMETSP1318-20131121/34838_1 /TAXON_ID=552666 /ORGANISM="Partenskyella glossopodia, Strain RCC365" /LENGTH=241 /DNA_ID=CAMNT_0043087405 /DNA_START=14 /DNA_END=739 /DNA_ORIENTATION=-
MQGGTLRRRTLQMFMAKPGMSEEEVLHNFRSMGGNRDELESMKDQINSAINPMKIEIRKVRWDIDGKTYWVLVTSRGVGDLDYGSSLDEAQVVFAKELMLQILRNNGSVMKTDAMRIKSRKTIRKGQKIEAIESLCAQQLLVETNEAKRGTSLCLGARGQAELTDFIGQQDDCAVKCSICHTFCVRGHRCSNEDCDGKLHYHCYERLNRSGRTFACKTCGEPFVPRGGAHRTNDDDGEYME